MKTIIIIRHAKSDWDNNLPDHDRPLNHRGLKDAPEMGNRLLEYKVLPDIIFSSTANRAISTAKLIANEINYPEANIILKKDIYFVGQGYTKKLIEGLEDKYSTIFIVGHNPDQSSMVRYLSGMDLGYIPTCSVVSISFNVKTWKETTSLNGEINFFEYPKKHQ